MITKKTDKTLEEKLASPCIQLCVRDRNDDICLGCGRTTSEINDWASYSRNLRLSLLKELDGRLEDLTQMRRKNRRARQQRR